MTGRVTGLWRALGLGFGLVVLLQEGDGLLRGWAVVYLSTRLGLQWLGNVFAHLLKLPLEFFEKRHLGKVVSRMGSVQAIMFRLTRQLNRQSLSNRRVVRFSAGQLTELGRDADGPNLTAILT